MLFTTNHDKNSWHASDTELFGPGFQAFAVLAATLPGMPLIYGGQEGVLDKRLAFFEKDAIEWKGHSLADFYRTLLALKKRHPALWNGAAGGEIEFLPACDEVLVAYRRVHADDEVTVLANLSEVPQTVRDDASGLTERLGAWGSVVRAGDEAWSFGP
jgi:hypothetical protein